MKSKAISGMMLTLLVVNALAMAFIVAPTAAVHDIGRGPDDSPLLQDADGAHQENRVASERSSWFDCSKDNKFDADALTDDHFGISSARWGRWDLCSVDEWRDRASVDEDSVELVIGINNAQPNGYGELETLTTRNGGEIVNTVSMGGKIEAAVADVPFAAMSRFLDEVQVAGLSTYLEPNLKFQAAFAPNDPFWGLQWGPAQIEADYAWNTTIGDPSVLVAVIDTGIDWNHPDLYANYVALGYDWVNNDVDPMDDEGHGTHCAGIIAALIDNNIGVAGLAQVRIMAEKGLDQYGGGYEDDLANAIIHAVDQGADILSNSWGGYGESNLIYDAVRYAYEAGVLVIAAAGNEAVNAKLYPAAFDEVIAVTATDQYDNPAPFTNFGEWVELAAPGIDIYSTYWDDTYAYMSGTSMATPHVSAVAALIWSQFPDVSRDWVRAQLRYTADDFGDPGFDNYYGYGRINARKAVEQAPPVHDLLIFDWKRPPYIKLGEPAIINITVLNFGTSDETNVEVQLLANSSLVDFTTIAFLPDETSSTVELSWTPTVRGTYNVTSYVVPVPGETITQNNLVTETVTVIVPPPDTGWILLATDPDEGVGVSLKAIYGQLYSDIIYFEVECYRSWTTINDIDTGILIDADQDPSTGLPDGSYPNQNTGIGADYLIVVGWEATEMWKWDPIAGFWDVDNPIALAYLDAPGGSNAFVVGVYLASIETTSSLDCAVSDIPSDWDWMPDTGHFSWSLIQYEHELIVLLETPRHLWPGDSSLLNATVFNVGLSPETSVELFLLINGTVVNSVTIPELVNGTSHTIDYFWTPTTEGTYNVTAYAPPVPDENVTTNNAMRVYVNVHYLEVALFKNVDPWGYPADEEVLSLFGIAYAVFSSSDFGLVDLTSFPKVVIASDQDPTFYNDMDSFRWWFEDYVGGGGILEIHAADLGWNGGSWVGTLPGGLQWVSYYTDYVTIVDPTHHVLTTPNPITDGELDGWGWSVHGYFGIYPAGSRILIIEDSTGYPAYLEFDYGAGVIVASSQTLEWAYLNWYSMLLENSLLYSPVKYPHELTTTLEAPTHLWPGDSSLLNATVFNVGLSNETDVELFLLINGTVVNSVTIPELVNGTSHTIDYFWTPTTEAVYNVTAYAPPVPDENVTANNRMSKIVYVRYQPKLLVVDTPYPEDTGALSILGYEYTPVTPTEFATVDLYRYNVLFIGWMPEDTLVNALLARASEISDWVAAGNGIVALAEFNEVNRWAWLPLSVGSSEYHADTVHILNPAHPVMSNLTDVELSNWGNSYHGYFTSYDASWEVLAEGVEVGQPITLAATYGAGRIAVTNQDPDFHLVYGYEEGAGKLLRNMIEWVNLVPTFEWDIVLTASLGTYNDVSEFGVRNDATDGFDVAFDALDPPPPPGSGVVSYFWYPDNPTSPVDMRKLSTSKIPPPYPWNWTYIVTAQAVGGTLTISWSPEEVVDIPAEYGVYLQCPDESLIDMRAVTEYSFTADSDTTYTFTIWVCCVCTLQLSIGWNLVSFACIPIDDPFQDIGFYQVYTWDGTGYVVPTVFEPGAGYWILVLEDTTLTYPGIPVMSYERDLPAGWSLIGSIYPCVVDATLVFPGFYQLYTWDGSGYVPATTIEPWKGYWVVVLESTHIVVDESKAGTAEAISAIPDVASMPDSTTSAETAWDVLLTASIDSYNDVSDFGVHPDATEGFDVAYDALDPPPPPGSGVVSYFWYPDNPTSPVDMRKLSTSKIPPIAPMTWTYIVKAQLVSGTMTISWSPEDIAAIPAEHGVYLQYPDGSVVDMRAQNQYSFSAESDIEYTFIIQVETALAYLVVRGLNNRIYYRFYNSSSGSWDSWNLVPSGLTCDSPAAAICCGDELHMVVRGFSGTNVYGNYSLWHGWINLTDGSFHSWTRLSGLTPSAPTLVCYEDGLILIVRGLNNRIYYRSYDCVSDEWEGWSMVPTGVTCDSPAATVLVDELHIVVRGYSATSVYGNYSLWHRSINLVTGVFSEWTKISGSTSSAPTLATSQALNTLYLVVRGLNNRIYYNVWKGSGWEGWALLPSGSTCDSPAATVLVDELHIVVRGMDGISLWHYRINLSTNDHSGWTGISGQTPSAPSLTC